MIRVNPITWLMALLVCAGICFSISQAASAQFQVTSPIDGSMSPVKSTIAITWVNDFNYLTDIYYSTDSGVTWEEIALGISGTSYNWTMPLLPAGSLLIRCKASALQPHYRIWQINSAHQGEIKTAKFSKDKSRILSTGRDEVTIKEWDANSLTVINQIKFEGSANIYNATYLTDDTKVIVAADSTIFEWNRISGNVVDLYNKKDNSLIREIAYFPNGTYIGLPLHEAGKGIIFSLTNNQVTREFDYSDDKGYYTSDLSNNGSTFLFAGYSGNINVVDLASGNRIFEHVSTNNTGSELIWDSDFSDDGNLIAVGGIPLRVDVYDLQTGNQVLKIENAHSSQIRSVKFNPDNNDIVLSGSLDGTINQYSILSQALAYGPINHGQQIISAEYSETGDSILVADRIGNIALYRNYEYIEELDTVSIVLSTPLIARLQNIRAKPSEIRDVKLEFIGTENIIDVENLVFDADITVRMPVKLSSIRSKVPQGRINARYIETSFRIDNIKLVDTLRILSALILLGDVQQEEMVLSKMELVGNQQYVFDLANGLLSIEETCPGDYSRLIGLGNFAGIVAYPNPAKDILKIEFEAILDCNHKIALISANGIEIKEIINQKLNHGNYSTELNLNQLTAGTYFIRMQFEDKSIDYPLTIIK